MKTWLGIMSCMILLHQKGNQSQSRQMLDFAAEEMLEIDDMIEEGANHSAVMHLAMQKLEAISEKVHVEGPTTITTSVLAAQLYNAGMNFAGLDIYANLEKVSTYQGEMKNISVHVNLPQSVLGPQDHNKTIVFCLITLPNQTKVLYGQLVGLKIRHTTISGLADRINITTMLNRRSALLKENKVPQCNFYDFAAEEYSTEGCSTKWEQLDDRITCSCDHLSYFAVLMVSHPVSIVDQRVMTYITLAGCSLSLLFMVAALIVFGKLRKAVADVSLKVHLNLLIALILLNAHFLLAEPAAAVPLPSGFCIYVAVLLHYSVLAAFTWTAIEGFHLYLLLVRVFNIYIRRYLLKLCLVGWGFPAVGVALVATINKEVYQRVKLLSKGDAAEDVYICYLADEMVKLVTIVGFIGIVLVFNLAMLTVVVRHICRRHVGFGPAQKSEARRRICSLLGITSVLGITWCLPFSCIKDTTCSLPVLYLFCILNSLQGFIICVWLFVSKRKAGHVPQSSDFQTFKTRSVEADQEKSQGQSMQE